MFEIEYKIELASNEQHEKLKELANDVDKTFKNTFTPKKIDELSWKVEQLLDVDTNSTIDLEDKIRDAKYLVGKVDVLFKDTTTQIDKFKSNYKLIDKPIKEIEKLAKELKTNIKKTIEKNRLELQTYLLELQKEEMVLSIDENDTFKIVDEEKKEEFEKQNKGLLIKDKITNANIKIDASKYFENKTKEFKRKFKNDIDFLNISLNENGIKETIRFAYSENKEYLKTLIDEYATRGIVVEIIK